MNYAIVIGTLHTLKNLKLQYYPTIPGPFINEPYQLCITRNSGNPLIMCQFTLGNLKTKYV